MPSRKKRKRYRRRMAEASAAGLNYAGGWGKNSPIRRGDWLLVRRAIREGWPITRWAKADIIAGIERAIDDPASTGRLQVSAIRLLLAMEADDLHRAESVLRELSETASVSTAADA